MDLGAVPEEAVSLVVDEDVDGETRLVFQYDLPLLSFDLEPRIVDL